MLPLRNTDPLNPVLSGSALKVYNALLLGIVRVEPLRSLWPRALSVMNGIVPLKGTVPLLKQS